MDKIDLTQSHDVMGAYKSIDFSFIRMKYTDDGTRYAFDVLDEKVTAGYLIKLAAFRHLRDLQRSEFEGFPYHYDLKECKKILKFATLCPNVDTGEPTELMPWQKFILVQLMGWRNNNGGKRFSRAIVSVGRGQGKTYLMAIIMVYSYLVESLGLNNQDYLVTSINYKQTSKILGYIKTMLIKILQDEPFASLAEDAGLSVKSLSSKTDEITMLHYNNNLRAISNESGQFDSFHFTTAIFDEIGEIKDRTNVSKIVSGQVKVANRQFIQISTAYPNPTVPFHDDQKMIQQAMEQDYKRDADALLGLIWSQDDLDETYKPETWVKSNPLLDLPDQASVLMQGLKEKRDTDALTGKLDDFQNKNMNMWLQEAVDAFLKLSEVERAIIPDFDIKGRQVYIGTDYSMMSDNTAIAFVYPYTDSDGINKWHVQQHSFIPWHQAGSIEAKEKKDGIDYRHMEQLGYCTITSHPQGLINDDQVYKWVTDYVEDNQLDVVFFGYDAMGITPVIKMLDLNTYWPLEPIRQRTGELKDPTKALQSMFVEQTITRLDDQIMEKALINAHLKEDSIGIQVDKLSASLKIDVVDAIIDALFQAMYHFEDFADINDPSKQFERMSDKDVAAWFEDPDNGLMGEK